MNFILFYFSLKTLLFSSNQQLQNSQQLTIPFRKGCYFPQLVLKNTIHSIETISIFLLL